MASLNKATAYTRLVLLYGGMIAAAIFVLIVLFRVGVATKEFFFPTPPPAPTVTFGPLPAIPFPEASIREKFTYALDTVSGAFPYFPDRATVFQITPVSPNLLNTARVREKAGNAGFTDQNGNPLPETKLSPTSYRWDDQSSLRRILTMDINSFNFTLTSSYMDNDEIKQAVALPNESKAIATAENFLDSMGLLFDDIDKAKTITTLLTMDNGTIKPATSFSTAKFVKVNLYQKDAAELPMVYPYPPYSLMEFLVGSGGDGSGQIVQAKYVHRDVTSESATYPIKTASQAFSDLQQGKGYVASYEGTKKEIVIREISLAYFIGDATQDYLLPVVFFEGDDNFIAYVSAVTDDWIKKDN